MTNDTIRKPVSYILMFVVFNALSNGQVSNSVGDTLNRVTASAMSSPAVGVTAASQSNSPSVVCSGNQLKISADNSTLASILAEVEKCTGAKIEVPPAVASSKVFGKLGPGPVREVLASLLASNGFDYVIGSSEFDPAKVETVLLMPHLIETTPGSLPENTQTAAVGAGPQTTEDARPAAQPTQVALSATPAMPNSSAVKAPGEKLAEFIAANADRNATSIQPSVPIITSQVARVESHSIYPNAGRKAVRSLETVTQTRAFASGASSPMRWREELTRFGISTDSGSERLSNVAMDTNLGIAHAELSWYPVALGSMGEVPGEEATLRPALSSAVNVRQITPGGFQGNGFEGRRLTGELHAANYITEPAGELGDVTRSPVAYPITWSQLGETIWQTDRLGQVLPVTLMIIILLFQLTVRSRVKAKILLALVPLSAIGAMWSLCFLHSNSAAAMWVGIIGLLSVQAEAGVFRLLHLERANAQAKSRGDLGGSRQDRSLVSFK